MRTHRDIPGTQMLAVRQATQQELERGYKLMRRNMSQYLDRHGLQWDEDWIRSICQDKDNYTLLSRNQWIGFLSLEAQGRIYGVAALEWIKEKLLVRICRLWLAAHSEIMKPLRSTRDWGSRLRARRDCYWKWK
jgi:hypothetical protein